MQARAIPISTLQTGTEFSVVTGLTYNFENPDLDPQNGIDWHLRLRGLARCQGVAGRRGRAMPTSRSPAIADPGATLGDFKSRVSGIGPQAGYLFPAGDMQGYVEPEGLRGIRRGEPGGRLECLADAGFLARRASRAAVEHAQIRAASSQKKAPPEGGAFRCQLAGSLRRRSVRPCRRRSLPCERYWPIFFSSAESDTV